MDRLEAPSRAGGLSGEDERRLGDLLAEHPLGARPGAVLLALVGPIAVVSAAGAGVAALAARRIAAPISTVAAQARRLAEGDLQARAGPLVALGSAGEIAGLVADFDRLGERLAFSEQALRPRHGRRRARAAHAPHGAPSAPGGARGRRVPTLRGGLRRLVGQARLLGRVVEDLATLSLAQAGRLILRLAPTDLAEAARMAVEAAEVQVASAGIGLRAALRPAPVRGDLQRLTQAAAALLDNALRHGGSGGEVRVETGAEGDRAVLRVLDRGPGVPEPLLASVFDPFARGEPSPSQAGTGSGLGLAVVRAVADAHGGRAYARPRPGGGAAFAVEVPLVAATQAVWDAGVMRGARC